MVIRNVSILHAGTAAEELDVFLAKRNSLVSDQSLSPSDGYRPMPTIFALPVVLLKLYNLVHQIQHCPSCIRAGVGDGIHCTRPRKDNFSEHRHLPLPPNNLAHNFNALRFGAAPATHFAAVALEAKLVPAPRLQTALPNAIFIQQIGTNYFNDSAPTQLGWWQKAPTSSDLTIHTRKHPNGRNCIRVLLAGFNNTSPPSGSLIGG